MSAEPPLPDPGAFDPAAWLGPTGPVAEALRHRGATHEVRLEQQSMAAAVARALSSGGHLLVEAGTGVGKSFAYLLPSLLWAAEHGTVVVVSTATIALQQQLVRRDLPLLASVLPKPVRTALVKGRGNYLCLRRLDLALAQAPLLVDDGSAGALQAIQAWSRAPGDGSRQELPFQPPEGLWGQVNAEQGNCLGRACRHFARCGYQASRQQAREAQLLVVNHHLLLADAALRRSEAALLPEADAVVVDEAHDLEEVAAEHLGARATSLGLAQTLGRLWSARLGKGLLARHPDPGLRDAVESVRQDLQAFFSALPERLPGEPPARRPEPSGAGRAERPPGPGTQACELPHPSPVPAALGEGLARLADLLERRREAADDLDVALEIGARARSLAEAAAALEALAGPGSDEEVRWAEVGARGLTLTTAPIDVGPLLERLLWSRVGSAILTSATLTTGTPPSFAYVRGRLGLVQARELALDSPFDYARQARLVLRDDLPDPARDPDAWERALPGAVVEAVEATRGGALVLFTATGVLQRTAAAVRERLSDQGLEVLVQGEGRDRAALLERFRATGGVLFGVASFWQGVDVPGDALRHVIITRLPFEVPTHPLARARRDRREREGEDPFERLTLPQTALRLKQGFGRLIRTRTDQGRVTILDPRVLRKRYGRTLLASLPRCPVEVRGGAVTDATGADGLPV